MDLPKTDVIVFGAHPDDAELSMGGTIAALTQKGFSVGLIDLTRGELGTRGSVETRDKEAAEAANILHISFRTNLNLPDGNIQPTQDTIKKVTAMLRAARPKIIFAPFMNDRHPDHIRASTLVKEAYFFSGTPKFDVGTEDEAVRPAKLYYFMQSYTFEPTFIVDISETFEVKMAAVRAYASQFYNPESVEPETYISKPGFLRFLESRAEFYGFKIGKEYGEAFYCEEPVELDLNNLLFKL